MDPVDVPSPPKMKDTSRKKKFDFLRRLAKVSRTAEAHQGPPWFSEAMGLQASKEMEGVSSGQSQISHVSPSPPSCDTRPLGPRIAHSSRRVHKDIQQKHSFQHSPEKMPPRGRRAPTDVDAYTFMEEPSFGESVTANSLSSRGHIKARVEEDWMPVPTQFLGPTPECGDELDQTSETHDLEGSGGSSSGDPASEMLSGIITHINSRGSVLSEDPKPSLQGAARHKSFAIARHFEDPDDPHSPAHSTQKPCNRSIYPSGQSFNPKRANKSVARRTVSVLDSTKKSPSLLSPKCSKLHGTAVADPEHGVSEKWKRNSKVTNVRADGVGSSGQENVEYSKAIFSQSPPMTTKTVRQDPATFGTSVRRPTQKKVNICRDTETGIPLSLRDETQRVPGCLCSRESDIPTQERDPTVAQKDLSSGAIQRFVTDVGQWHSRKGAPVLTRSDTRIPEPQVKLSKVSKCNADASREISSGAVRRFVTDFYGNISRNGHGRANFSGSTDSRLEEVKMQTGIGAETLRKSKNKIPEKNNTRWKHWKKGVNIFTRWARAPKESAKSKAAEIPTCSEHYQNSGLFHHHLHEKSATGSSVIGNPVFEAGSSTLGIKPLPFVGKTCEFEGKQWVSDREERDNIPARCNGSRNDQSFNRKTHHCEEIPGKESCENRGDALRRFNTDCGLHAGAHRVHNSVLDTETEEESRELRRFQTDVRSTVKSPYRMSCRRQDVEDKDDFIRAWLKTSSQSHTGNGGDEVVPVIQSSSASSYLPKRSLNLRNNLGQMPRKFLSAHSSARPRPQS